jgi:hypothetical protein
MLINKTNNNRNSNQYTASVRMNNNSRVGNNYNRNQMLLQQQIPQLPNDKRQLLLQRRNRMIMDKHRIDHELLSLQLSNRMMIMDDHRKMTEGQVHPLHHHQHPPPPQQQVMHQQQPNDDDDQHHQHIMSWLLNESDDIADDNDTSLGI